MSVGVVCQGRESRYVPWSFGEIFECLTCALRVRQDHRLGALRGEGYDAVYPMPEHEVRPLAVCAPCSQGFHDICSRRHSHEQMCDCATCLADLGRDRDASSA